MKTKASLVIMSHLSDIETELDLNIFDYPKHKIIGFIKYIIMKTNGDLNTEIDADNMYADYLLTL